MSLGEGHKKQGKKSFFQSSQDLSTFFRSRVPSFFPSLGIVAIRIISQLLHFSRIAFEYVQQHRLENGEPPGDNTLLNSPVVANRKSPKFLNLIFEMISL